AAWGWRVSPPASRARAPPPRRRRTRRESRPSLRKRRRLPAGTGSSKRRPASTVPSPGRKSSRTSAERPPWRWSTASGGPFSAIRFSIPFSKRGSLQHLLKCIAVLFHDGQERVFQAAGLRLCFDLGGGTLGGDAPPVDHRHAMRQGTRPV